VSTRATGSAVSRTAPRTARRTALGREAESTRRVTLRFGLEARLVPQARQAVGARLQQWGLGPECAPLELAVSELFTNAVRHGRGPVTVQIDADDEIVRLEVCDRGGGNPTLQPVDRSGTLIGGWGLHVVDQLADAWGSEVRDGRTIVWIERAIRAHDGEARAPDIE
jgi:anti-sigma regulatory factor (Ser/Thr protein kinase)